MARKRMFRLDVLETDAFMDMPLTTQALYFHLNLRADDDGFIGNPNQIVRLIGASSDDLKLLIAKRFVLVFEDGVIVIKHWRMHNTLSANRYKETNFIEDKALLKLKDNNAYTFAEDGESICDDHLIEISQRQTKDEQKTNKRRTQNSIEKNSIEKNNKDIRHKYGEYKHVLLSDEDMEKLKADYQDDVIDKAITILDEYIETSGRKYKNHYLVLKKWTLERAIEEIRKGNNGKSESGTRADVESDEDLQRRYEQVMRQLEEDGEDEWA